MASSSTGVIAAAILCLAAAAPAGATIVTGSFTGTVSSFNDPGNVTGFASGLNDHDHITGSFSFDTAAISAGFGSDTLVIFVHDTVSDLFAAYSGDLGTGGLYGNGSYFAPDNGAYDLQASSGASDYVSQVAVLNFISPAIHSGNYAPAFTLGAGTGSYGYIEADYYYGTEDGYVDFSIDSATMTAAALPEPAGVAVLGLGLLALMGMRRTRAA